MKKHKKSYDFLSAFNYYLPTKGGVFALFALLMAGSILGSIVVSVLSIGLGASFSNTYGMLISYPVMFIPAMIYASAKSHRNEMFEEVSVPLDTYRMPKDKNGKYQISTGIMILMCAVATLAIGIVVEPLVTLIPREGGILGQLYDTLEYALKQLTGGPLYVAVLSTAVFAPLFEEWLCRGLVMRGLLHHTKSVPTAIIFSAVFFAVIHLNPWQAIPAFMLGCIFGLVYYKTGSLKLTMLMHCVNNLFSVICSKIPALEGKDYLYQALDKTQYGIIYLACLCLAALFVYRICKIADHR